MSIEIRNWDRFQHADVTKRGRAPIWIKLYTEILSDEAFLALTGHRRAVLLCLWLEYARTRRRLPHDTATLSRRLALKVTTKDLEALGHAGFIEIRQDAVTTATRLEEKRGEKTKDQPLPTKNPPIDDARARTDGQTSESGIEEERPSTGLGASGVLVRPGSVLERVEAQAARESGQVAPGQVVAIETARQRRDLLDGFMAVVAEAAAEADDAREA